MAKQETIEVRFADAAEAKASLDAASERIEALEGAARALLGGIESFVSSWPFTAPEALGSKFNAKIGSAARQLDRVLNVERGQPSDG